MGLSRATPTPFSARLVSSYLAPSRIGSSVQPRLDLGLKLRFDLAADPIFQPLLQIIDKRVETSCSILYAYHDAILGLVFCFVGKQNLPWIRVFFYVNQLRYTTPLSIHSDTNKYHVMTSVSSRLEYGVSHRT